MQKEKHYGRCEKIQKYQTCSKLKKKELFSIKTKLSNYKVFYRKFYGYKNKKNKKTHTKRTPQIFMSEPVYLGLPILELNKMLMYEFWYDYVKPKYDEKAKLCYMDTDSFIVYIKTNYIYKDIAEDVETRFDASNDKLSRPLPKGKIKKVIGLMKHELHGKIIKEYVGVRTKSYSYFIGNEREDKKER